MFYFKIFVNSHQIETPMHTIFYIVSTLELDVLWVFPKKLVEWPIILNLGSNQAAEIMKAA